MSQLYLTNHILLQLNLNGSNILCHLPVKGRRKIEEIVEDMKERDRRERGK